VHCRLSDVAPVRARGFDHTTQGAYAVAAGVSRALGMDAAHTAHAIALAGASLVALRVTRTGALSNWKGLAYPFMASCATQAAYLARRGITGPREVFEGNKGFSHSIAGAFDVEWERESFDHVERTILKRYNAEIHAQAAIEAILELTRSTSVVAANLDRIEIDIFDVAHSIIGGGEEGDKRVVITKEDADHSLPYMAAVVVLDGELGPAQYDPARIARADVQALLRRVVVRPDAALSRRFPREHPCRMRLVARDGGVTAMDKSDYEGFSTRPMRWETTLSKFTALTPMLDAESRARIVDTIGNLEDVPIGQLCFLLANAGQGDRQAPAGDRGGDDGRLA
jgi:2-methylcitrate dehydratase